jgi:hypothetical protein
VSPLDYALDLARRGLSVIRVPRPDDFHNGKEPYESWKHAQSRRATEDELRRQFGHGAWNLAIVCGAVSDVVMVDPDSPEGRRWCVEHLPYTPWQTTTGRGFHLFYRHPGARVRNKARLYTRDGRIAVDVRGDGGLAIAPGSVHVSGRRYEFAGDWRVPRAHLPRFSPAWLEPAPVETPTTSSPRPRPAGDLAARARAYLAAIPAPAIGAGSDAATLYAACRMVRGFGLPEADAETLLWEWAGGRPGWTRGWVAQKVTHAARYGTETVGALR